MDCTGSKTTPQQNITRITNYIESYVIQNELILLLVTQFNCLLTRSYNGAPLFLRHLRRRPQAQGPLDAAQAVPQPREAVCVYSVYEGVQEERAADTSLCHSLGREETCVSGVWQGIL